MIPQSYKCIGRKKGGKKLKAFIVSYNEGFQLKCLKQTFIWNSDFTHNPSYNVYALTQSNIEVC